MNDAPAAHEAQRLAAERAPFRHARDLRNPLDGADSRPLRESEFQFFQLKLGRSTPLPARPGDQLGGHV